MAANSYFGNLQFKVCAFWDFDIATEIQSDPKRIAGLLNPIGYSYYLFEPQKHIIGREKIHLVSHVLGRESLT